jgi:FkbM family methyltransferase
MSNLPPALAEALEEPMSSVAQREASTFDELLHQNGDRIVLFGCGGLARKAIAKLAELGVTPLALCDNNQALWGASIESITVMSVEEAASRFGSDALFLVAVWNPHHWFGETEQRLKAAGAQFVTSYLPLFWKFPHDFLQVYLLNDLPSSLYAAKQQVLEAEALWADELSLHIYRANIYWRALGDPTYMPPRPPENTYFPADIFAYSPDECIVDCGAYDGDTLKQVLDRCGSDFRAMYCIEGDAVSFAKLQAYVHTLPSQLQARIHLIHGGVGHTRSVVRFSSTGETGSHIGDDGVDVQCYPLDELEMGRPVTFIKMDIEGAEYDSLLGAQQILARDQPLVAVCVYHTQQDIWRLPLLLHSLLPKHRLYLRAYEGDGFQTVAYAVPPRRVLSQ